ncbi:three-helix bundle dimerization domain-containing protein [Streptacidiphilus sp. PAMC 29251]
MLVELQEEAALERVREQLHRRYDPVVSPGEVDRVLRRTRHRFEGRPVRTFVPILVERSVRVELDQRP